MSIMYPILKSLADKGKLTAAMITKALNIGWITQDEADLLGVQ